MTVIEAYQNFVGLELIIDTHLDVTADDLADATVLQILVKKPSGSTVTWTAIQYLTTDKIAYVTKAGDLDELGNYILEPYVTIPNVIDGPGDSAVVVVVPRFSMTYSGDPSYSAKDFVRFKINDTQEPFFFTDTEILAMLKTDPPLLAAHHLASRVAIKYASRVNKSIGDGMSISYGDLLKNWTLVANDLLDEYRRSNMVTSIPTIDRISDTLDENIPPRAKQSDIPQADFFDTGKTTGTRDSGAN